MVNLYQYNCIKQRRKIKTLFFMFEKEYRLNWIIFSFYKQ